MALARATSDEAHGPVQPFVDPEQAWDQQMVLAG
jgi:hypothetical protein